MSTRLENEGLVSSNQLFWIWARFFSQVHRFQAGTYRFSESVAPREIAQAFINGDVYQPVVFEVTIPEGFTVSQIIERLAAKGAAPVEKLRQVAGDTDFIASLGIPSTSLEGYLYPATYPFIHHPSPEDIFRRMVSEFRERLPIDYEQRVNQLGLSLAQAITFASLIERETKQDDERPLVSEVIWNRLNKGIALAIDASIIFGIPDFDGDIRRKHLIDRNNLYNTRVHPGLPPGPICSPTIQSLLAVLTPTDQGLYYYVVDAENFDRHRFSKTLSEHNRYVREYLRAKKARELLNSN